MDASGNYDLKVEFLDNDSIDEEEEFRNFCMNIWVPGSSNDKPPASVPVLLPVSTESATSSSNNSVATAEKPARIVVPTAIKRVKPTYVQSLRPETAHVADDDVRLTYARAFFNTFNGSEKEDIGRKLHAFCVEDCVMSVKWIGERGNPCGPNYREVRGMVSVSTFLEAILVNAVPDAVMQLQDSKLRVKPDRSSYLLCKYTFNGTQVTKIEPVADLHSNYLLDSVLGDSLAADTQANKRQRGDSAVTATTAATTTTTTTTTTSSSTASVLSTSKVRTAAAAGAGNKRTVPETPTPEPGSFVDRLPMAATVMLPSMIKMTVVGTLIIHINPANKIYRFEYIQKLIRMTHL